MPIDPGEESSLASLTQMTVELRKTPAEALSRLMARQRNQSSLWCWRSSAGHTLERDQLLKTPPQGGVFYYLLDTNKAETAYCSGHQQYKRGIVRLLDSCQCSVRFASPYR